MNTTNSTISLTNQHTEVVFIEDNITNYDTLLNDISLDVEVHRLKESENGLTQIANILKSRSNIDALHIISHASKGTLQLGSFNLTQQNLPNHRSDLAIIRNALSENADILLYGCNIAADSSGKALIEALARETQADVTASDNLTGANKLNGDWLLEYKTGLIDSQTLAFTNYNALLATPSITAAVYNASTNLLTVTGADMSTGDLINIDKLTLTGEGGNTYTLTGFYNVTVTNSTTFSVTLTDTDAINVEGLLNNNGTSAVSSTVYNLAGAASWDVTATAVADTTANPITVSNVQPPTISSATYERSTGTLVVTGSNLVKQSGAANDIDVTKLTLTGQGSSTFTLTGNTSNVEIDSATSFRITLGSTDKTSVDALLNQFGTSAADTTIYNVAAADDWNGTITNADISDTIGNGITVNTAPTATNFTQTPATFNEGAPSVALTPIVITEPDSGDTITATLTLANPNAGTLTTTSNKGETYNSTTGIWTVSGAVADVNTALAALAFIPSTNNGFSTRINTHIQDTAGNGPSDGAINLNITPANNAPTITSTALTSATPNSAYSYAIKATDADGNRLSYSVDGSTPLPSWLSLGVSDAINVIAGTWGSTDLSYPTAVAFDSSNNMYIADYSHYVIRKIDATTGTSTIVAGVLDTRLDVPSTADVPPPHTGEGGLATSAYLRGASDIEFDSAGNLYFADYGGRAIRKVDSTTGVITTVAGVPGMSGTPGLTSSNYVDPNTPMGLTWDFEIDRNDNIYIANAANNAIYKVSNGKMTLVAGLPGGSPAVDINGGSAFDVRLKAPTGIADDPNGDLYIADRDSGVIRKVNMATGIITTVAGTYGSSTTSTGDGGLATAATLNQPHRLTIDGQGNIYIEENANSGSGNTIRFVDTTTGLISTIAGPGTTGSGTHGEVGAPAEGSSAKSAWLYDPYGITLDNLGNLYLPNGDGNVVLKVSNQAILSGTPNTDNAGAYNITLNVSDGITTTPQSFTLNVNLPDGSGNITPTPTTPSDSDGVASTVEAQVPSLPGPTGTTIPGDGNGDGIADAQQSEVTSVPFLNTPTAISNPSGAPEIFITLAVNTSNVSTGTTTQLTGIAQLDTPTNKPTSIAMPLGLLSFSAALETAGTTENFSLFVDGNIAVNGYWKQTTGGSWVNLASHLEQVGDKLRIDFSITDGGPFDADGQADGIITDPGAFGFGTRPALTLSDTLIGLYVAYYDRAPDQAGLQYWLDQAEAGFSLAEISAGFAEHPRFAQEYDGLNALQIAGKLYQNVLHRSGDSGGITYWTNQLDTHPLSDVMVDFVQTSLTIDLDALQSQGQINASEYSVAFERQKTLDHLLLASRNFINLFGADTVPQTAPEQLITDPAYRAAIEVLANIDNNRVSVDNQHAQLVTLVGHPDPMADILVLG